MEYIGVEVLGGHGPHLWSPHSWSLPHLCLPLVHHCPLPLTSLDPQLTDCHLFNPTHSWFVLVGPRVPSVVAYLCLFNLVCPWCAHLPLFALMRPILPIHITNHVRHFWDDLGRFTLKDNKGQQKGEALRPFVMSYTILQYSKVLPFTSATFSDAFRPFATFLDFAFSILCPIASLFQARFIRPFSHD